MQLERHYQDGRYYDCCIPDADVELMPGTAWGEVGCLFTPAFWRFACITNGSLTDFGRYHFGSSLKEEMVACLLGGHGITGELGISAFKHLKQNGVLNKPFISAGTIEALLSKPLNLQGRKVRYRYPHQKARFIAAALEFLERSPPPVGSGRQLRDWLTQIPGIGNKTASWIARNWLNASDVAILDIHIHRAGVIAGFFMPNDDVAGQYQEMESKFVEFAGRIGIPANVLDNQIWNQLRVLPQLVRELLIERGATSQDRCGLPAAKNRSTSRNYELFANA